MEIIHLILGKANPERMNGVNKVVHELSTRQSLAGERVEVWGITANPVHDYPARTYTTRLFPSTKNPFELHSTLKKAIRSKRGQAVFHLHGGFIPAMFRAAMYMRRLDIHFVFTPHGSYNTIALRKSGMQKKLYFRLFEKPLLKAATSIHSLGKSEVAGLQLIYPNNKTTLIPYGFEMMQSQTYSPTSDHFIIGYCGRIDIYTKGLDELLYAFKAFNQEHPDSRLWIIGNGGEMLTMIKMTAALGLEEAVVFHGAKFGEEKNALLQQCHVFAAPSRNEGLPTAVLEAASLGIPCLVTEATNTGDAIRRFEAGVVIPQTEREQIRQALIKLHENIIRLHQQGHIGANARRMIHQEYNWKNIIARFHQLYN